LALARQHLEETTMKRIKSTLLSALLTLAAGAAHAGADWHELELQYFRGNGFKQFSGGIDPVTGAPTGGSTSMNVYQLSYSNGWKYGGTYFYVANQFDGDDIKVFSQGWEFLSLNKILGKDLSFGPVKEVRLAPGWQFATTRDYPAGSANQGNAPDIGAKAVYDAADTKDLFFGLDFPLAIPGFDYAGLTAGVYRNFQDKTRYELQPSVNFYYRANWFWGDTRWRAQGFVQWYGARDSRENPNLDATSYVYSQNSIALDAGYLLWERPNQLYVGTQIQFSRNSYGVKDVPGVSKSTDEFFPQIFVSWVF
jgi:nucleoside-specific outer membrane channel protein Tsx